MISMKFDTATDGVFITGEAGKQIKIYQIHISNNHTTKNLISFVSLTPTKFYYGGNDGRIYLRTGGQFQLIFREAHRIPYFVIDEGESLWVFVDGRVSGEVLYEVE